MKRLLLMTICTMAVAASARAGNCFWITPPSNMTLNPATGYSVFSQSSTNYTYSQPFSFQCSPNTAATLTLTKGTNSAQYSPNRTVKNTTPPVGWPAESLDYNLYNTANQIWGDGSGGSVSVTFQSVPKDKIYNSADGAVITGIVAYGRDVAPGTYIDTIQATLSYPGGPVTATFTITVNVSAECQVGTFGISFGTYDPVTVNATALSPLLAQTPAGQPLSVQCTKSTQASIGLNNGLYRAGTRRMQHKINTSEYLDYELYTSSGYSTVWNLDAVTGTSTSKNQLLGGGYTIFGRIRGGQNALRGDYQDTVQATVNY